MFDTYGYNQINAITTTAARTRATLPPVVQDVIDHAEEIGSRTALSTTPHAEAERVTRAHLGDRNGFDKARATAIKALLTVQLEHEFDMAADAHTTDLVWKVILDNRDGVTAAIGEAMKDNLAEAHALALRLPSAIDTNTLDGLTGDNYRDYRMFEQITEGWNEIASSLWSLYEPVVLPREYAVGSQRLIFATPNSTVTREIAEAAQGLHTVHGRANVLTVDPWVALAHLGPFTLHTPTAFADVVRSLHEQADANVAQLDPYHL